MVCFVIYILDRQEVSTYAIYGLHVSTHWKFSCPYVLLVIVQVEVLHTMYSWTLAGYPIYKGLKTWLQSDALDGLFEAPYVIELM